MTRAVSWKIDKREGGGGERRLFFYRQMVSPWRPNRQAGEIEVTPLENFTQTKLIFSEAIEVHLVGTSLLTKIYQKVYFPWFPASNFLSQF